MSFASLHECNQLKSVFIVLCCFHEKNYRKVACRFPTGRGRHIVTGSTIRIDAITGAVVKITALIRKINRTKVRDSLQLFFQTALK